MAHAQQQSYSWHAQQQQHEERGKDSLSQRPAYTVGEWVAQGASVYGPQDSGECSGL
jgi:hypothetical protein